MFSLLQSASDDQTAIGACVAVLAISALFVFTSYHLGPAGQKQRNANRKNAGSNDGNDASIEHDQSRERAA